MCLTLEDLVQVPPSGLQDSESPPSGRDMSANITCKGGLHRCYTSKTFLDKVLMIILVAGRNSMAQIVFPETKRSRIIDVCVEPLFLPPHMRP